MICTVHMHMHSVCIKLLQDGGLTSNATNSELKILRISLIPSVLFLPKHSTYSMSVLY